MVLTAAAPAHALLGSGVPDIEKFKGKNQVRQTLVYIDLGMMRNGDKKWAGRIDAKLASSLMPGERVTVLSLDTANGVSEEIWSACWPDYSREEKDKISKEQGGISGFFSKNPLSSLEDEQRFFRSLLGNALGTVYERGQSRPATDGKRILSALASDEDRFNKSGMVTRVIIYSDMGSLPLENNLSLDLGYSIFYIYGVDAKHAESREEWEKALMKAHGLLASFSYDLGITSGAPVKALRYNIDYSTTKNKYLGDLVLLVTGDGKLQDSYAAIRSSQDPLASVLRGSCKLSSGVIKINAVTRMGLATEDEHEQIELSGREVLNGIIGHPEYKLEGKNTPAKFKLTAYPAR